jgi:hypothetical protein
MAPEPDLLNRAPRPEAPFDSGSFASA